MSAGPATLYASPPQPWAHERVPRKGHVVAHTVADFTIERLREWGVRRIYGYPGDGINGLTSALRKAGDAAGGGMDFVQARHEEMAAFMASAHAKYTGEIGVCLTTSGPGAIHALNGLYDAKMDHQPVLALVGQQPRTALGGSYYQEVDLVSLFKDVAGDYVQLAVDSAQMRHLVDRACRIALAERTVTALIVPNDLQETDTTPKPPRKHAASLLNGLHDPGYPPREARPGEGGRRPQFRREGGDARGPGGAARHRGGHGGGRYPRGRGRQGPSGQGRRLRPRALGHRRDRLARHRAFLGPHAGGGHPAHGRHQHALLGLPAERGAGQRRPDRHKRQVARLPLPDRGQPRRRLERDPSRSDPDARAQDRPLLAGEGGAGHGAVVEGRGGPRDEPG